MVNPPEQPMKNLSLGNSSANEASTTPSAKSRLARLGVPFKSDPAPSLTLTPTPTTRSFSVEKLIASLNDDSSRELSPSAMQVCSFSSRHEKAFYGQYMFFIALKVYANVLAYMYALINTTSQERPQQFLRLTSLGVIGSLVKQDNTDIVNVLLEGDIVSKLLLCLEVGNLMSKTVAAFIFERLLTIGDMGQMHCCASAQRFFSITRVLGQKIEELVAEPCQRLRKHIICCYIKLSQNPRACDGLVCSLPMRLKDGTLLELLKDDPPALMGLQTLVRNVTTGHRSNMQTPPSEAFSRSIKGKAARKSPMQARSHSK